MTAWESEPTMTEDELNATLAAFARVDPGGLAPVNTDWEPTYDLNAAAAQAWLIKAARASTLTEIAPAGSGIVTSKIFDNCRTMARLYGAKRQLSVRLT